MKGEGIIELLGMEFHAFHGCLQEERREGNLFIVDFKGKADLRAAAKTDELADTEDYGAVYKVIAQEMARPSDLLEHVAGRIVRAIEDRFPRFIEFSVSVAKQNPPVGGPCRWSRVTLTGGSSTRKRGQ